MAIPKNKKRIIITIPKDWDYLLNKAKEYAYGESMSTSNLFIYLVLEHLYEKNYLDYEAWKQETRKWFYDK